MSLPCSLAALTCKPKFSCLQVLSLCEDGCRYPSTTFLAPLQLGRSLPSPRHAARFVSLLRRREEDDGTVAGLGGGGLADVSGGCWSLLHTVLASGSASKVSVQQSGNAGHANMFSGDN